MDPKPLPNKPAPVQQTSPEEDAALLAIEALEAQSVELDTPAPQPTPIQNTPPTVAVVQAVVAPVAPQPPAQPVPSAPVAPKPEPTLSQAIDAALASTEPAPKRFQFFAHQKPPRKPFVIGGILAILVGLAVGAYFTLV